MSYVDVNAPLPRNGRSPVPACETAAAAAQVQSVETSVANAQAASAQLATPQSFAMLGQGVQNDVARSQTELVAALRLKAAPPPNSKMDAIRNAPQVLPLNVPVEDYTGCAVRGIGPAKVFVVSQAQGRVIMPPRAPTDTHLLFRENTRMVPARPIDSRYRGMGVVWGDAIAAPRFAAGQQRQGISGKLLFALALGGVGLYAMGKKGRR